MSDFSSVSINKLWDAEDKMLLYNSLLLKDGVVTFFPILLALREEMIALKVPFWSHVDGSAFFAYMD